MYQCNIHTWVFISECVSSEITCHSFVGDVQRAHQFVGTMASHNYCVAVHCVFCDLPRKLALCSKHVSTKAPYFADIIPGWIDNVTEVSAATVGNKHRILFSIDESVTSFNVFGTGRATPYVLLFINKETKAVLIETMDPSSLTIFFANMIPCGSNTFSLSMKGDYLNHHAPK